MKYQASASVQLSWAVQGGTESGQQGAVAQGDVGELPTGGAGGGQWAGIIAVGGGQPGRVQPGQELRPIGERAAGSGDGEGEHGLGQSA